MSAANMLILSDGPGDLSTACKRSPTLTLLVSSAAPCKQSHTRSQREIQCTSQRGANRMQRPTPGTRFVTIYGPAGSSLTKLIPIPLGSPTGAGILSQRMAKSATGGAPYHTLDAHALFVPRDNYVRHGLRHYDSLCSVQKNDSPKKSDSGSKRENEKTWGQEE